MIKVADLRVGDVVGTTSGTAIAAAIKIRIWGWRYAFSQSKSNHIATVVTEHGLNYFMEMLGKGIHQTDINEYDHWAPRKHVCWVGRHTAFDDQITRDRYNEFILKLHEKNIKYGWDDIAQFITGLIGHEIKDNDATLICSELPLVGFQFLNIAVPAAWNTMCSPKDWQVWSGLQDITKQIAG